MVRVLPGFDVTCDVIYFHCGGSGRGVVSCYAWKLLPVSADTMVISLSAPHSLGIRWVPTGCRNGVHCSCGCCLTEHHKVPPQPLLQGVSKDAARKQGLGDRKQHVRHWKQQVKDKI